MQINLLDLVGHEGQFLLNYVTKTHKIHIAARD